MIIARLARSSPEPEPEPEPEDRDRVEKGRKLAITLGLSEIGGPSEIRAFMVRTAKARNYERGIRTAKAYVTSNSNYNNEDENYRAEIGRKLALVAGVL